MSQLSRIQQQQQNSPNNGTYSPSLIRRIQQQQQHSSPMMQHLYPQQQQQQQQTTNQQHPYLTRMTNQNGQNIDIYENPSEHYSSIDPLMLQQQQQQQQSEMFLPTMQPAHFRTPHSGMKPRYYMESNNGSGPQLKVGYGKFL